MTSEVLHALPSIALLTVLGVGGLAMAVTIAYRTSKGFHDKRHTHHSELGCDHCKWRAYYDGHSTADVMRRWPMRITGSRPPRGEG